jgi:transcriptional regulator with XRE-family HTH domain
LQLHVRSGDSLTFGAEIFENLVSAIISVQYSDGDSGVSGAAQNVEGGAGAVGSGLREKETLPVVEEGSPTVRRRRLAAELRQLREDKGRSGESVAHALGWSPSKISRYERAKTGLRPREVERLLNYYGVAGAKRQMLLSLAEDASQRGWWDDFGDTVSDDYQQFIGLEHEATTITIWHVDVVAGLLQTDAYARHIINSYDRIEPIPPAQVNRLVRVRMRRQQVLERPGLQVNVVLDESVLLRRIGTDAIMHEQLERLAKDCERDNLHLQILPLDAQHTIVGESFVLFGFEADGDAVLQDVVSTEQMRSGFILEGERETHLHRVAFRTVSDSALSLDDSRQRILDIAADYWTGKRG